MCLNIIGRYFLYNGLGAMGVGKKPEQCICEIAAQVFNHFKMKACVGLG